MKKLFFSLTLILLFFVGNIHGQNKPAGQSDIVFKADGQELKGKVTKITDSAVTFIYSGETVEYVFKKADLFKIKFGSGREEIFANRTTPAETRKSEQVTMTASPVDHHNKIAVLPFSYLMDNQPGADAVGIKAQEDTYSFLSSHSAGYTILDPRTTNSILAKAGITKDKMVAFTMKELCDTLGVEYIIDGTVIQNKGYQTSSSSSTATASVKRDDNDNVKKVNAYGSNYGNSVQRYDVSVGLHIYMDNNASIYNQTHKAFFTNTDGSFSSPLEYLLKRCPLYRK